MEQKIRQVLDKVRPALQADGGDVEFIDFHEGVVVVRMRGACGSCPMRMVTLKQGIAARQKARLPEVLRVEQI